ncbi:hypothetical protein [Nocardioides rubriscoriae]|uniref:hypothetical protein n=1 Tax=Nocardioides rubriscoriae TaxID=642762 RepID=UPI0011DF6A96|nr:hypothetical protein [Nocardioides rubriscoriae]
MIRRPLLVLLGLLLALLGLATPAAQSSPSDDYVGPHYGKADLPAGCVLDRDPLNPDNHCYHMKVGLNALDSPQVDVDILVPVSPAAERDLRQAEQAVQMWNAGLHYLADQMDLGWLDRGLDMRIRTHEVAVDPAGALLAPLDLVDPEIVVVASNPVGGIGIGVDPSNLVSQLGVTDGEGLPCARVADPFSMAAWQHKQGFEQHGGENGGVYVEDCGGVGGNVCFAVNGAVDPVPGASDFFGLFDLISHEFGHCLTVGHVGDGADGPWGPTPTNDIMAYSTDPPGISKCVSTLDVEGFALRMSHYLDVNGDGKVTAVDHLEPNDPEGDGANAFQVQHPDDHHYASPTGEPGDCPQPSNSLVPGSYGDFVPKARDTTRPRLAWRSGVRDGRLRVTGTASRVPLGTRPTAFVGTAADATSDSITPITDLTGVKVKVTRQAVDATMSVSRLWPVAQAGSVTAYSLLVSGRRFDSFIGTGTTDGVPVVMDNGTGYYLPAGTARWDFANNQVTFHLRRDYLADQQITAPYTVFAETGLHARANDWITTTDAVPDARGLALAAPPMAPESRDAPVADRVTTRTVTLRAPGDSTFVPSDSTLGVGLVSVVDSRDYLSLPVPRQATVTTTLTWDDPASTLGLSVNGGSGQRVVAESGKVVVTVPWARRDLSITVDPQQVLGAVTYSLSSKVTTVRADRDHDHVPDVADRCRFLAGPSAGAGCPDTDGDGTLDKQDRCPAAASVSADGCPGRADDRVVLTVDGRRVDTTSVVTRHGSDRFALGAALRPGRHVVVLTWVRAGEVVARQRRTVG